MFVQLNGEVTKFQQNQFRIIIFFIKKGLILVDYNVMFESVNDRLIIKLKFFENWKWNSIQTISLNVNEKSKTVT